VNIESFLNATELSFRKLRAVLLYIFLYYLHPPTLRRTAFLLQLGSYRGCEFTTVCKSLAASQSSFWLNYADRIHCSLNKHPLSILIEVLLAISRTSLTELLCTFRCDCIIQLGSCNSLIETQSSLSFAHEPPIISRPQEEYPNPICTLYLKH
jgi:hypothetical protein